MPQAIVREFNHLELKWLKWHGLIYSMDLGINSDNDDDDGTHQYIAEHMKLTSPGTFVAIWDIGVTRGQRGQ